MNRKTLLSLVLLLFVRFAFAGEGMWIPLLLSQLNETEMQEMGMKMTAEDIYSVNQGSLKDAIVHFGGFCTGELVSNEGLVLTNYHCGKGQVQSHSSLENNYLDEGFWAYSKDREIPNPGLFVRFIVRIEDVTEPALAGVTGEMSEQERQSAVDRNLNQIRSSAEIEAYQEVMIRPFFEGNQYFLFVTETYRDVRLVGAPPASIGEFGKDTDNWVWPRHTGDFSLFRIYAGPDNKPAEYSPDNKPFQPRHFLPISLDGVTDGDFSMVFGFPGSTDAYLPATAIELKTDVLNPVHIGVREKSLAIIDAAMRADEEVRIQYASKQAGIANYWKFRIGESLGVKRAGSVAKREAYEAEFMRRLEAKPALKAAYGDLLSQFAQLYDRQKPYAITRSYVSEITGLNIELFGLAANFGRLLQLYENNGEAALQQRAGAVQRYLANFYADYRPEIDRAVFAALMEVYFTEVVPEHRSPDAWQMLSRAGEDYEQFAADIYGRSLLAQPEKMMQAVGENISQLMEALKEDPAMQLLQAIQKTNDEVVMPTYNEIQQQLGPLQRRYMQAQMEVFPERKFYPDANSTLRVSYGKVDGYVPRDAVRYVSKTYLSGIMEKYEPGDYEFDVPEKLRTLYERKDYGPYAEKGGLPVCFVASLHSTGGNSGSPVVDASGNLTGLLFDGNWEGPLGDIAYDPSICRSIMVDIRYVLFIIDKFAGAENIMKELKLVRPKSGGGGNSE